MIRYLKGLTIGAVTLAAQTAAAVPMANPAPGFFAEDTEGAYVQPGPALFAFELFDLADGIAAFGFHFAGDPGTLIELFGADDVGPGQSAAVDFAAGIVGDLDALDLQASFTPTLVPGPIGFWIDLGGFTLFSDAALNGGLDVAGIFPLLGDPSVIGVTFSDPTPGGLGVLSLDVISGASAITVPEPTSLGLLFAGSPACGARWRNGRRTAGARA